MGLPDKTGIVDCHHCALPIKRGKIEVTESLDGITRIHLIFCSAECFHQHFFVEHYKDKVWREVSKEKNWLWKRVCMSCRNNML
jgi:hypothetical protein